MTRIIYGSPFGQLLMIPENDVYQAAAVVTALRTSKTWADFALKIPNKRIYNRYLRHSTWFADQAKVAGASSKNMPPPETLFDGAEFFASRSIETLPYFAEREMLNWVPAEVLDLGDVRTIIPVGSERILTVAYFGAYTIPNVIEKMRSLGFTCVRDEELIRSAMLTDLELFGG